MPQVILEERTHQDTLLRGALATDTGADYTKVAAAGAPGGQPTVGKSVIRGALALLSTQPLTWGASLLLAIVVPRLLGADLLGQYAIVVTISGLAATVAVLGISEYLVRRFAQQPQTRQQDLGVALVVQTASACLTVLGAALIGWFLPSTVVTYPLLIAGLLAVFGAPAQTTLLSAFRGSERHQSYAWFNAVAAVSATVALVLVLLAGGSVVLATAAGSLLTIVSALVGWKLSGLRPILPRLDQKLVRSAGELARGGFPFLSWQLTLLAYGQINRLLLGVFASTTAVGWFAAAYQIIAVVVFVPTLVIAPLFPALSRSVHEPSAIRKTIAETTRIVLFLMVGLCVASIVAAPVIPRLLGWPTDFDEAVPLMMILAPHLPIVSVDMILGAVLMAIHRESRLVLVGLVTTVINVLGNIILIPYFQHLTGNGAMGAAVMTVGTEVCMCVGALILIPRHLLDPAIAVHAVRLTIAGAASTLLGLTLLPILLVQFGIPILALLASWLVVGLLFVCLAVILRAVSVSDVRSLTAHLPGRTA
jgi:O-antigen/teichoic acid export membrane protein